MQIGVQVFVWGVLVRTVYVWHITWLVNSASHRWGYRNYETSDRSRNNWVVALLTNGEGWHNNHHATPRACSQGHRWWEIDLTFTFVRVLADGRPGVGRGAGARAETHPGCRPRRDRAARLAATPKAHYHGARSLHATDRHS